MKTTENNLWNHAVLTIYWRADRHQESHSVVYKRPTEENPCPDLPVKVRGCLSTAARYSCQDEEALKGLRRVSDPAFLLKHKEELEKYWQPLFEHLSEQEDDEDDYDDDGKYDAWA